MRFNLAGYNVEIKGVENIIDRLKSGSNITPEVHINQPTIIIPASEVIKKIAPWVVISIVAIWITVLLATARS